MKKGRKKLFGVILIGAMLIFNTMTVSAELEYPESFSVKYTGGYTASGSSVVYDEIYPLSAVTSCSAGISTSTSAEFTYFDAEDNALKTTTAYAVGQYGSRARCAAPNTTQYVKISVKGTHNYTVNGTKIQMVTNCYAQ